MSRDELRETRIYFVLLHIYWSVDKWGLIGLDYIKKADKSNGPIDHSKKNDNARNNPLF